MLSHHYIPKMYNEILATDNELKRTFPILCLTSRTTFTSACIPDEGKHYHAHNLCVFSHVQKGTPGLTYNRCTLQRVSLGTLSYVTVCSWDEAMYS